MPVQRKRVAMEQINIDAKKTHSQAFRKILQAIHGEIEDKQGRNWAYREFSIGYNSALKDGCYEDAIVYLMLMRSILIEDGNDADAYGIALLADDILGYILE